jgi:hypothetical protein
MTTVNFHYLHFWNGFFNDPTRPFQTVIERIFDNGKMFDGTGITDVYVFSVFGCGQPYPNKKPTDFWVGYSGEPHTCDTELFDINLIMRPDDIEKNVVSCPLFIMDSESRNFWPQYMVSRPWRNDKPKDSFCAFVVSNTSANFRFQFFMSLSQYKRVESCGTGFNNCGFLPPPREAYHAYYAFLSNYKFMICFENTPMSNYLTEKLHNAWLGGTIPIYWGCTSAPEWLNPKAFVYVDSTSEESVAKAIAEIIRLDNDDVAYKEMYEQPLLLDNKISDALNVNKIQEKVRECLRRRLNFTQ